jgi:DNA-nicking Smr family endonuclease
MGATPPPEDDDLARQDREFLAAMEGQVAPAGNAGFALEAAAAAEATRDREEFLRHLADHPPGPSAPHTPPSPASVRGLTAGDLRRLSAGPAWLPDGQIDLHGRTRVAAVEALERFVRWAERDGLAHILVVVGQGHHSPGGETVVADAVRRWLDGRGLPYIAAPGRLGGNGALLAALSQPGQGC